MNEIYLHPHLGLGDAIILNGLIRHYCNEYDSVILFCKEPYYESIKWMFRDIKNLTYHVVTFHSGDSEIQNFITSNNLENKVIKFGFEKLAELCSKGESFYDAFYLMHNFTPEFRFHNFYYERDLEIENYIFNKLNPDNEKYIFVIDDGNHHIGNLKIPQGRLPTKYKIINYDKSLNYDDTRFLMFNYYKILENAEEIHTLETAFFEFIRSINIEKSKVYIHSYLRKYIDKPIDGYNFLNS